MPDESKPVGERSYKMGNVGAGARVAQGENISRRGFRPIGRRVAQAAILCSFGADRQGRVAGRGYPRATGNKVARAECEFRFNPAGD